MAPQVLMIRNITDKTKSWEAHIQVISKEDPRDSQSKQGSSTRFQKLLLCDAEGTQIHAAIFGKEIATRAISLVPNKFYSIKSASVKRTPEQFCRISDILAVVAHVLPTKQIRTKFQVVDGRELVLVDPML